MARDPKDLQSTDWGTAPTPKALSGSGRPSRLMAIAKTAIGRQVAGYRGAKLIPPPPPKSMDIPVVVASKQLVADRAVQITFASPSGAWLPAWYPGSHIDVVMPSGLVRQYSLCGNPDGGAVYTIIVRDHPLARGPRELIDSVAVGDPLTIRGPRNLMPFAHPALRPDGVGRVLFVAAGIGITPLAAMVRTAHRTGVDWHLVYVGQDRASMPLLQEMEALGRSASRTDVICTESGRPTAQQLVDLADDATAIYVCGPEALLSAVREEADARGIPALHAERFRPPSRPAGLEFSIRLARSGQCVSVTSVQSALDAVHAVLPSAPYSCRQGFCGTCRVDVLDGEVLHRASAAYLAADKTMLLCSDVGRGTITVDL